MTLDQRQIQHLYWRTGFGISLSECKQRIGSSPESLVEEIFSNSSKPNKITVIDEKSALAGPYPPKNESEELRQFRRQRHRAIRLVNLTWMYNRLHRSADLREKMMLFWHNHFACEYDNPFHAQSQINFLSASALGNFKDLLVGISKDPAMLLYLNTQQNSKTAPNENYARELMELFTLGRGNYTETDVKEAARAFTGWKTKFDNDDWDFNSWTDVYDKGGWSFIKVESLHDSGIKTVLGKSGPFDGEDIIDILLANRLTAKRIAGKLYQFFVNEEINEVQVEELADVMYQSGYDISTVLKTLFTAEWFYDEKNMGNKIKSPMEYLVGMFRSLHAELENKRDLLVHVQQQLGQVLLHPPNVGGWPSGKGWINNSSLFFRMKLPEIILADPNTDEKYWFNELRNDSKYKGSVKGYADISKIYNDFKGVDREVLYAQMYGHLIQSNQKGGDLSNDLIVGRSSYFISNLRKIMQLPQYQLC